MRIVGEGEGVYKEDGGMGTGKEVGGWEAGRGWSRRVLFCIVPYYAIKMMLCSKENMIYYK